MIKIVKTQKSWIESNAEKQLSQLNELRNIKQIVGLPDLHAGRVPVGCTVVSEKVIYPHLIGNDIGCGMTVFMTNKKHSKFKIERIMKKLENIDISKIPNEIKVNLEIPKEHLLKLGTIGGGNHFCEFQKIDKVFLKEEFEQSGYKKEMIYMLVHSGSRSYGQSILSEFIEKYKIKQGLSDEKEIKAYLREHDKALKFAEINRELIAKKISEVTNVGIEEKKLDIPHNFLEKKEERYYHRKGACPSNRGLVLIAGSRGSLSYLIKPKADLSEFANSVSHGAGRKWNRMGCKERLENIYKKKDIKNGAIFKNLICKDKALIYEEAKEAYKSISQVIEDMVVHDMIEVVATFKPLITYKV